MDGAMGTLIAPSLTEQGVSKDSLNLKSPETILSIHRQYLDAGADILKTNTFNSSSGPQDYELNVAGARLARAAADKCTASDPSRPRLVAGAMGPGRDGSASIEAFYEQARGLADGGADILMAETITSIRTAKSAQAAFEKLFARIGRELPVMLSVTISKDGTLLSNETLEAFWDSVSNSNLFAVGINCSFGARRMRPFIERLAGLASTNISCHPSAGLPNASGGYDETPEEMAAIFGELASEGLVDIAGGCCGTTPAHIRAIADAVRRIPRVTIDHL
jgi:5-methyltetrahydrofolate--homocysteine methyltransferase